MKIRIVKKGKAKDYVRGAKYYNYYYIIVNKTSYTLNYAGWISENIIKYENDSEYVEIDNEKYFLDFSKI